MCWITFISCVFGVLALASSVQTQDPQGTPGVDYPNYFTIPETSFKCSDKKYNPGFYADVETKCQAFHFCFQDRQESFLCPTGTIFNQAVLTCDAWYKSNCSLAQMSYSVNVGPIMERAGRNLPMLLRLRNRSQNEATVRHTPSIFDQVSSLYETSNETPSDTSIPENSSAEETEKSLNSPKDSEKDAEQMILDSSEKQDTENEFEDLKVDELPQDSAVDTNLVYDPDNGYYTEYDQYEEWQTDPINEEFENYYKDPNNEYVADESSSRINYINEDEPFEYSDVEQDYPYHEFTRRSSVGGQLRVRRKPIYVLDDQPEYETGKADAMGIDRESESIVANGEMSEETNPTSEESASESTPRPEPFPRPTRFPPHLLELSTETPMTSAQFERAILSELVYPNNPSRIYLKDDADASVQSRYKTNEALDTESDDTIYIENDLEPENYVPYSPQYEDMSVPEQSEESNSQSLNEAEGDSPDTEDTFVVIPDEYDNANSFVNDDSEMINYPDFYPYQQQMLEDGRPFAGYGTYEYPYRYTMDYSEYEQAVYPEEVANMYGDVMPNNERYDYESNYDLADRMQSNYESPSFENEDAYASTEQYPYAKLGVTERPLELPVTDADLDNFEIEDFNELENLGQDSVESRGQNIGQPEDVYYVIDEQPSEENESKKVENIDLNEPSLEESQQTGERNHNTLQSNSSNEFASINNASLESERFESKTGENSLSSNSKTTQDEQINFSNIKYETEVNPANTYVDSNLGLDSQQTPLVPENFASLNPSFSSNMGSVDFSTDPRFLSNMGYLESMDFGPYGFGPNMGQFSMMESVQNNQAANPFTQRTGQTEQPKLSPLSAIQEKMRSMKQGKFGAFKKYMSSTTK